MKKGCIKHAAFFLYTSSHEYSEVHHRPTEPVLLCDTRLLVARSGGVELRDHPLLQLNVFYPLEDFPKIGDGSAFSGFSGGLAHYFPLHLTQFDIQFKHSHLNGVKSNAVALVLAQSGPKIFDPTENLYCIIFTEISKFKNFISSTCENKNDSHNL